jgi:hypothetical protein
LKLLLPLGLLVALAVVGPLVAHLLRRRRPVERPFPPARLVPRAPPVARRRAFLEDRALLSLRALGVLALALLAASPLVRCSSLSLDRRGGASVALAIVIDDSMSMSAELPTSARRSGAKTRFDLAIVAARELGASLRSGDSVTVVLAGAPARVVLPMTTDVAVVRATLEQVARDGVSDRATDLDGAVALAAAGMRDAPHADRRVVLLSDLADGQSQPLALPTEGESRAELAAPLDALRLPAPQGPADCAIVMASPEPEGGARDAIRLRLACAMHGAANAGRSVEIVLADGSAQVIGSAKLPDAFAEAPATFEVVVPIDRKKAPSIEPTAERPSLTARLTGSDAIARDDAAPVLGGATAPILGVVVGEGGAVDELVATGGAPILERALRAIESGSPIRPLPSMPDREVDLAPFAGIAIDDPPGFAPETRAALARWIERGGVLLIGAGSRVASPPLGSSFEPALARAVRWERLGDGDKTKPALGVDASRAGPLANGTEAPADLAPHGRAVFDREDVEKSLPAATFTDGAPLLLRRTIGEGEAWIVGLPFSPEVSDLPLRPGFLGLLDAWIARARERSTGARLEIGQAWSAGADDAIEAVTLGARGERLGDPLAAERAPDAVRVRPRAIGPYLVSITPKGGSQRREVRAVSPAPREVDLAPRPLGPSVAAGEKSGLERATVPLGPTLAALVTALAAIELLVRGARLLAPVPRKREDEHDEHDEAAAV